MLERQQLQIYLRVALYLVAKYNSLLNSSCVHTSNKQQNFRCKPRPLPRTDHARQYCSPFLRPVQSSPVQSPGFVLSQQQLAYAGMNREYTIAGLDRWTGLVDWTDGLETCRKNVVDLC